LFKILGELISPDTPEGSPLKGGYLLTGISSNGEKPSGLTGSFSYA